MGEAANLRHRQNIWNSLGRALGADPREDRVVTGASGLEHPVQLVAVDEKGNRVVIVSSEPNARVAALMQVDVQAAMPETRVIVARPIVFDLGVIARKLFPKPEDAFINLIAMKDFVERIERLKAAKKQKYFDRQLGGLLAPVARAFQNVTLPALTQIVDVVQQFSTLDWPLIFDSLKNDANTATIPLTELRNIDNLSLDRKNGICPLPLYEFSDQDWELFASEGHIDDVQQRLRDFEIYQYFFPPPDRLALGLVERGLSNPSDITGIVARAPALGHPLSDAEFVSRQADIPSILEALKDIGYVAEGEHGVEITPTGTSTRSVIKFRPQESVFQRILNRFNVSMSLNPKDFFPPH